MNRRGFFKTLSAAVATFAILPSATTYGRKWVKQGEIYVPNPAYFNARYEIKWFVRGDSVIGDPIQPIIHNRMFEPFLPTGDTKFVEEECPLRFEFQEDAMLGKNVPMMIPQRKIYAKA